MGKYIEGFKVKYKTEICKNWETTGECEFKSSCSFAHGAHELKQKTDIHKNYKTKQCKRFSKDRYCPYGIRCQFIHDEAPSVINAVREGVKGKPKLAAKSKKKAKVEDKGKDGQVKDASVGEHE